MNHVSLSDSNLNRAARRSQSAFSQQNRLRLGAAGLAGALCALPQNAGAAPKPVRLADANTYKKSEIGPKVQLMQPGYNATLSGTEAPIVVSVAGRKFAPKTLELFVDGLNASNGKLELDSTTTVELKWDTTLFKDGTHRLTVRVTDTQGFTSQSETQIYINNKGRGDTAAPVLSWLNINDHDIFKGVVDIQLKANDNFGVKYIFVSINAAITPTRKPPMRQWLVNHPPYSFSFDTSKVPDGTYVLDAIAWDERENEGRAPTRTFGVLNNALNATLFNDGQKWGSALSGTAKSAPVEPTIIEPKAVDVPLVESPPKATNPNSSKGGATKGGTTRVQKTLPNSPPVIARNPEMPPVIVGPVESEGEDFVSPDAAMTSAQSTYNGAVSKGVGHRAGIVVETTRTQPGRIAAGMMRPRDLAPVATSSEAAQISPVTRSAESKQSTVDSGHAPTRDSAELRITPPMAKPRIVGIEKILPTPDSALTTKPIEAGIAQPSIAPQPIPSRTAHIATLLETTPTFPSRTTAPEANGHRAEKVTIPAVPAIATGERVAIARAGETATVATTHSVPLPTREPAPLFVSPPVNLARIERIETRPASGEAEISIASLVSSTAVARRAAPRVAVSNPLRGQFDLQMFARIERSAPVVKIATATPKIATVKVATPKVAPKLTAQKVATTKIAPALPKFPRVSALPETATTRPKRDIRNAITLAPMRSARHLPASFIAPRDTFLSAIAAQHGISTEMLAAVNNLPENAKIARGREVLFPREISVRLAGKPIAGDVASLQVGATSVTAFRKMFEQSGGEVKWDAAKKRVTARDGSREITLTIGSKNATVDQREVAMDMAAFLLSGRTMVPVRFFEKALAARVEWEPETGRLLVSVANAPNVG